MTSVSFDRIAHLYDATRGYPDQVAQGIAASIEQAAQVPAGAAWLELGIGTGRIGLPLAERGHHYSGIDISENMLKKLEAKLQQGGWRQEQRAWGSEDDEGEQPPTYVSRFAKPEKGADMRLMQGDMTALPLRDASFDCIVAVHVFHLVSDWQKALEEAIRVVRQGGVLLYCRDHQGKGIREAIGAEWRKLLEHPGGKLLRRPGASSTEDVMAWLLAKGLQPEVVQGFAWVQRITPRRVMEGITGRSWSGTWEIPDDIFVPAAKRLQAWTEERYRGVMDQEHEQAREFVMMRTRVK